MVTSAKMNVRLSELESEWSVDDLADAHAVLDALDDAEAKAWEKR